MIISQNYLKFICEHLPNIILFFIYAIWNYGNNKGRKGKQKVVIVGNLNRQKIVNSLLENPVKYQNLRVTLHTQANMAMRILPQSFME